MKQDLEWIKVHVAPDAHEAEIQPGKGHKKGAPISEDEAVEAVRDGADVIAKNKATARRIAERAGVGEPEHDMPHGPGQLPHYHPRGLNGERTGGHVMY